VRTIRFQERSMARTGLNFHVLFFLIITFWLSASVATYGETVYPREPRPRSTHHQGIEGRWFINAGGTPGKLEFYQVRGTWGARVWFDYRPGWEELVDIFFDPTTSGLRFTRPSEGQRYDGTLRGDRIIGTYIDSVGATRQWEARKY